MCGDLWARELFLLCGNVSKHNAEVSTVGALLPQHVGSLQSLSCPDEEELLGVGDLQSLAPNLEQAVVLNHAPNDDLNHAPDHDLHPPLERPPRLDPTDASKETKVVPVELSPACPPESSVEHSSTTLQTRSVVANHGRPRAIRPLEKSRGTYNTRSTLKTDPKRLPNFSPPVGTINRGTDCYAHALFQLLARCRAWRKAVRLHSEALESQPAYFALHQQFLANVDAGTLVDYPDLFDTLTGE